MTQSMTYSQFVLTQDQGFIGRISSVLKDEGFVPTGSAVSKASEIVPDVAAEPGLAEAYHSALISDPPREDAGVADDVITDGVLLSAVATVMDRLTDSGTLPA